jgi:hypothetical protein
MFDNTKPENQPAISFNPPTKPTPPVTLTPPAIPALPKAKIKTTGRITSAG